jgi:predicted metal-dependent phosphoesterase TrpH
MKCDLHVHSYYSGKLPVAILRHFFLESYSQPADVYATLRKRGMDLVTLTDHDSITGAEELRRHADFFISEEVTCTMPSGTQAHVGVYDLNERQHCEISRRRNDMIRLLCYLSEQRLFFTVNHVFSSVTGRRKADDFEWFSGFFPAVEARNGQMLPSANEHAAEFAWSRCKTQVAGSDAHALASVGTTYTEVRGARDKDEFFAGLRAGHGRLGGESGSYLKLTRDILLLCIEMMREDRWTILLSPLMALVPAGVAVNYLVDLDFVRRWGAAVNSAKPARTAAQVPVNSPSLQALPVRQKQTA